ncbi:uncharacterized protein LOC136088723 [Hydra vulgaris]|uniref:Uncharacterized protein LOC136088723 n=1 Tax=Hydra vulgaris TaxID=6087 RepID=A0ABM4D4U0_HYDVU
MGRPPLNFDEASERTKRRKTEEMRSTFSSSELAFASQMSLRASGACNTGVTVKDLPFTIQHRVANYIESLKLSQISQTSELCAETALSILMEAKLFKHQYCIIRSAAIANSSSFLPSYEKLKEAKKMCYSEDITVTEISAEVKLQSLLNHTCLRIIKTQQNVIDSLNVNILSNFILILKWGFDGSSGHSEYKQRFADGRNSDANVFLTSLVPLQLLCTNSVLGQDIILWKNRTPSSTRFCRPIRLQFLHENVHTSINEKDYIEDKIKSLVPLIIVQHEIEIKIHYKLVMTMIDGKVCNAIALMKSTMRCYLCSATSSQFNNINFVKEIKVDESKLEYGLSTLHAWIRFFECFLHLGYKLGIKKWQVRSDIEKSIRLQQKLLIQNAFKLQLGLIVDRPITGCGNTNDGNTAQRFFKNSQVSADILGVDLELINRFHVVLQVLSSGFPIDADKLDNYSTETALLFVEKYPWYNMPTTVHKVLIHGALITKTAILPIGQLPEDAQESRNKDSRRFLQEKFQKKYNA